METFVIVTLVILTLVFLVCAIGITLILQYQFCKCEEYEFNRSLVNDDVQENEDLELEDFGLKPIILQKILNDPHWTQEGSGAIPVCLEILHIVHNLLEHSVTSVMLSVPSTTTSSSRADVTGREGFAEKETRVTPAARDDLVRSALSLGRCVDDLVTSMYPPIRLATIESKCCFLECAVKYLIGLMPSSLLTKEENCQIEMSVERIENLQQELRKLHIPEPHPSSVISTPMSSKTSLFSPLEDSNSLCDYLEHVCHL